jgi:hypothetical protein
VRVSFELTYEAFDVGSAQVTETRQFSLDRGSRFTTVSSVFETVGTLQDIEVAAGIVIHPNSATRTDQELQMIRAWEPLDGDSGYVGIALISSGASAHEVAGHLALSAPHSEGAAFSYALGSAWSKAGVPTVEGFDQLIDDYLVRMRDAPIVTWVATHEP